MGKAAQAKRALRTNRPLIVQGPKEQLPPWTPLVRTQAVMDPVRFEAAVQQAIRDFGKSDQDARSMVLSAYNEEMWHNSRYRVNVRRYAAREDADFGFNVVHLSITRLDKEAVGREHFRDFQRIKNEIVGPDCEGVELYPKEDRLVDTANTYHLWVVDSPAFRFPFGFNDGRLVQGPTAGPARQAAFED